MAHRGSGKTCGADPRHTLARRAAWRSDIEPASRPRVRDIQPCLPALRAHGSSKPVWVGRLVVIRPVLRRPSVRSPPKRRPTCPRVLTRHQPRHLAHLTLSAPFRVGHQARIRPVGRRPRRWRPTLAWSSVSCRLSTHRRSLLGHPVPLRSWPLLTVGLPTRNCARRTSTGFPRSARASYDRGGCPLYPEDHGAHPTGVPSSGPRVPLHSGQSLDPAVASHRRGFT